MQSIAEKKISDVLEPIQVDPSSPVNLKPAMDMINILLTRYQSAAYSGRIYTSI